MDSCYALKTSKNAERRLAATECSEGRSENNMSELIRKYWLVAVALAMVMLLPAGVRAGRQKQDPG